MMNQSGMAAAGQRKPDLDALGRANKKQDLSDYMSALMGGLSDDDEGWQPQPPSKQPQLAETAGRQPSAANPPIARNPVASKRALPNFQPQPKLKRAPVAPKGSQALPKAPAAPNKPEPVCIDMGDEQGMAPYTEAGITPRLLSQHSLDDASSMHAVARHIAAVLAGPGPLLGTVDTLSPRSRMPGGNKAQRVAGLKVMKRAAGSSRPAALRGKRVLPAAPWWTTITLASLFPLPQAAPAPGGAPLPPELQQPGSFNAQQPTLDSANPATCADDEDAMALSAGMQATPVPPTPSTPARSGAPLAPGPAAALLRQQPPAPDAKAQLRDVLQQALDALRACGGRPGLWPQQAACTARVSYVLPTESSQQHVCDRYQPLPHIVIQPPGLKLLSPEDDQAAGGHAARLLQQVTAAMQPSLPAGATGAPAAASAYAQQRVGDDAKAPLPPAPSAAAGVAVAVMPWRDDGLVKSYLLQPQQRLAILAAAGGHLTTLRDMGSLVPLLRDKMLVALHFFYDNGRLVPCCISGAGEPTAAANTSSSSSSSTTADAAPSTAGSAGHGSSSPSGGSDSGAQLHAPQAATGAAGCSGSHAKGCSCSALPDIQQSNVCMGIQVRKGIGGTCSYKPAVRALVSGQLLPASLGSRPPPPPLYRAPAVSAGAAAGAPGAALGTVPTVVQMTEEEWILMAAAYRGGVALAGVAQGSSPAGGEGAAGGQATGGAGGGCPGDAPPPAAEAAGAAGEVEADAGQAELSAAVPAAEADGQEAGPAHETSAAEAPASVTGAPTSIPSSSSSSSPPAQRQGEPVDAGAGSSGAPTPAGPAASSAAGATSWTASSAGLGPAGPQQAAPDPLAAQQLIKQLRTHCCRLELYVEQRLWEERLPAQMQHALFTTIQRFELLLREHMAASNHTRLLEHLQQLLEASTALAGPATCAAPPCGASKDTGADAVAAPLCAAAPGCAAAPAACTPLDGAAPATPCKQQPPPALQLNSLSPPAASLQSPAAATPLAYQQHQHQQEQQQLLPAMQAARPLLPLQPPLQPQLQAHSIQQAGDPASVLAVALAATALLDEHQRPATAGPPGLMAPATAGRSNWMARFPWPHYLIGTRDCFTYHLVALSNPTTANGRTFTHTEFFFKPGQQPADYIASDTAAATAAAAMEMEMETTDADAAAGPAPTSLSEALRQAEDKGQGHRPQQQEEQRPQQQQEKEEVWLHEAVADVMDAMLEAVEDDAAAEAAGSSWPGLRLRRPWQQQQQQQARPAEAQRPAAAVQLCSSRAAGDERTCAEGKQAAEGGARSGRPPLLPVGVVTYTNVFTPAELLAIEAGADGVDAAARAALLPPSCFESSRAPGGDLKRTKLFFGARYLWTREQLSAEAARRANGVRVDVPAPVPWMLRLVEAPLVQAGIAPAGFVNSVALNHYHDGSEGILPHFDDAGRFERPIHSLRLFSDSRLAFGTTLYGYTNGSFFIPMPRGAVTVLEEGSYAANGIKHCVRPMDMAGKSAGLILRKINPSVLEEARCLHMEETVAALAAVDLAAPVPPSSAAGAASVHWYSLPGGRDGAAAGGGLGGRDGGGGGGGDGQSAAVGRVVQRLVDRVVAMEERRLKLEAAAAARQQQQQRAAAAPGQACLGAASPLQPAALAAALAALATGKLQPQQLLLRLLMGKHQATAGTARPAPASANANTTSAAAAVQQQQQQQPSLQASTAATKNMPNPGQKASTPQSAVLEPLTPPAKPASAAGMVTAGINAGGAPLEPGSPAASHSKLVGLMPGQPRQAEAARGQPGEGATGGSTKRRLSFCSSVVGDLTAGPAASGNATVVPVTAAAGSCSEPTGAEAAAEAAATPASKRQRAETAAEEA